PLLTLYPLSVGGQLNNETSTFRWTVPNAPAGPRWRSVRTVLGPSGSDISRAENLEFWAQIPIATSQSKNPTLVFDFGDISENSVSFGPDTLIVRPGAAAGKFSDTRKRTAQSTTTGSTKKTSTRTTFSTSQLPSATRRNGNATS